MRDGRVAGVRLERADRPSGSLLLEAPAVLLAGGGAAGLYAVTTNPARIRGQALGMAARAGAVIADAEFVQFHPTALVSTEDPAPLATEALRGAGALLVNAAGERFMLGLHPDAELAPRDVVARAIHAETVAGRRPMLDTRAAIGPAITARFPAVAEACVRVGIDPVRAPIPVVAAAHYHMGGVAVDRVGRSTLPGLWAAGEASSTGLHGANRLASNGLLEALVYARLAADDIAASIPAATGTSVTALAFPEGGEATDAGAVAALRALMSAHVGVLREADGLRRALDGIAALDRAKGGNEALANMLAAATMITAAALLRRESRGGHWRRDYPRADEGQARRSCLTLAGACAVRDQMELLVP